MGPCPLQLGPHPTKLPARPLTTASLPLFCHPAQDDMLHEQHTAVHAFHHHIPQREQGSSGTGIIWLLVLLHAFFLGYWGEPPPPPGVAWQQQQAQAPAVCVA